MNFAVFIQAPPHSEQNSLTALHFIKALLKNGHKVSGVFFYGQGVWNVHGKIDVPQDEPQFFAEWEALALRGVNIYICSEAVQRWGLDVKFLPKGSVIAGLGTWIDILSQSHRAVTFGD